MESDARSVGRENSASWVMSSKDDYIITPSIKPASSIVARWDTSDAGLKVPTAKKPGVLKGSVFKRRTLVCVPHLKLCLKLQVVHACLASG